jgi:hypothetical protein
MQASTYSCSKNTTRRRRATAVRAKAPEKHRDASILSSVGRQHGQEQCAEYRETSLGQVFETAARGGGRTGAVQNAGHRPP